MIKIISFIALFSILFAMETERETIDMILNSFKGKPTKDLFKTWHFIFKKGYAYESDIAKSRYKIFKNNLKYINDYNAKNSGVTLGLNQFADLTNQEFRKLHTDPSIHGKVMEMSKIENERLYAEEVEKIKAGTWQPEIVSEPRQLASINWTSKFLPVRDQGDCGSCWAFSTVGAIEGNRAITKGNNAYISPQELVDCDTKTNLGCDGGWATSAFNFVMAKGLALESNYPYTGYQSQCNTANVAKVETNISGYKTCQSVYACNLNNTFYNLLAKGPLTTVIDAGSNEFQFYQSGVLNAPCSQINHGVIAVGYGISGGQDYWIIRNSWGTYWGNQGYVWIKNNNYGSCYVTNYGWLPIVTK